LKISIAPRVVFVPPLGAGIVTGVLKVASVVAM